MADSKTLVLNNRKVLHKRSKNCNRGDRISNLLDVDE